MARTAGSVGERTATQIREAGIRLVWEHGYEAMSLRRLAAEVGLQPGSLYNHFPSKQALLFDIVRTHMEDLTAALDEALAGVDKPEDRLVAFAAFHLRYHMTRRSLVYIANSELRSLEPDNRARIVALRSAYESRLMSILDAGRTAGVFAVPDVAVAAFALIAMLTGVCEWYRPDGRLTQDEIVDVHVSLVLSGVGRGAP